MNFNDTQPPAVLLISNSSNNAGYNNEYRSAKQVSK